jgi:hypothetical protein
MADITLRLGIRGFPTMDDANQISPTRRIADEPMTHSLKTLTRTNFGIR